MSVLSGPNEGNWSVFAMKVVEERDEAKQQLYNAKLEIDRLNTIIVNLQFMLVKDRSGTF